MNDLKRQSPLWFEPQPLKTELRDHWDIVLTYAHEGPGPWLVDLCHKPRWDLQDGRLDERTLYDMRMPTKAGECRLKNRVLINRMNRTQAGVWQLGHEKGLPMPSEPGYTDVSEATVFLGLLGPHVFSIAEKLTALDFMDPNRRPSFLIQGPVIRISCQIVVLSRAGDGVGTLLLTCARGYGRDMVRAILTAGRAYGLRPAGEERFTSWIAAVAA